MGNTSISAPIIKQLSIQQPSLQQWLVAVFMAICLAIAWWLTPHTTWFDHIGKPDFEVVVPKQFGNWVVEDIAGSSLIIDPQQRYALDNIYSQTVGRTYLHKPSGRRIMFSLAYGDNQTYSKQLHRPESCYSSQGFKIENLHQDKLQVADRPISVMRMTATIGSRLEQVTYFIRVGDRVISGPSNALNYARMRMGLKGYTSDGLLFRVSEVADDAATSNELQDQFIKELLQTLSPSQQTVLIGPSL
jgi:EpsI family protein